jgi:exonuclease SbcC
MALFSFRGKPAWESRDAAERAAGVAAGDDPALWSALPDLARADESPLVRRAALRRLADLPLLGDRSRNESDPEARALAGERYRALLAGATAPVLPLAERERVLRTEDDADVLAHVAVHAPEAELRRLALERSARPGLLHERCLRDPDAGVRLWLLSRIDALPALERIAEGARKSDKRLSHAARERIRELRLDAGDPAMLRERALEIGEHFDRLRRERPADLADAAQRLREEWTQLAPRVDAALVQRVGGYIAALDAALAPREVQAPQSVPEPAAPAELPSAAAAADEATPREPDPELLALAIEAEGHVADLDPASLDALRARHAVVWRRQRDHLAAEIDARQRFDAAIASIRARHAREEELARGAHDALREALQRLDDAVAAQRAQDARDARAGYEQLRSTLTPPPALARRAEASLERCEALLRWQHWSNNKVRSRLCEEIETLAAAGAHPDAVATRVREAQAEWQKLDTSERLDAEAAAKIGLARRFRAVCHRALAPARGYFEKRGELRQRQRSALDTLLERAEGELPTAVPESVALRRELVEALRGLDALDPRQRGGLGKRLRAALDRLDAQRDTRLGEAAAEKRKLLANLRRQLAQAGESDALALARDAQSRLAVMTRADRESEAAIRAELAALVDPLFARERDAREGQQKELREREQAQAAVLEELARLAQDPEALRHADSRIAALNQRWRELAPPAPPRPESPRDARGPRDRRDGRDARPAREPRPRDDDRRFDSAVSRVREAQQRIQAEARREETRGQLALARACAAVESAALSGDALDDTLDALAATAGIDGAPAALQRRAAKLLAWRDAAPSPQDLRAELDESTRQATELALRADLLRGVDSPAEHADARRALQMRRLAERMSGGTAPDPVRERRQLLEAWLVAGPLEGATRTSLAARIEVLFAGD